MNSVTFLVQLPPPINGLSVCSAAVLEQVGTHGQATDSIDLSPKFRWWPLKVASRMLRWTAALARVCVARRSSNMIYMPVDSRLGIIINISFLLLARALRYKVVLHYHNYTYLNRRSRLMDVLQKLAWPEVVHVVLCAGMGKALQSMYWKQPKRPANLIILSNAFLIQPRPARQRRGVLKIGILANLSLEKGVGEFIELFETLRERDLDVEGKLAGPLIDERTQSVVNAAISRSDGRLQWLGPINGSLKWEFYEGLDVFVFPTKYEHEAQPIVLFEALACGCALITTPRGCIREDHGNVAREALRSTEFRSGCRRLA